MSEDLYHPEIVAWAAALPREERLDDAQATVYRDSPLCGSRLWVDLSLGPDGRIGGFGHKTRACLLGKAATRALSQCIVGTEPGELRALRDRMHAMLTQDGPPPDGAWAAFSVFAPARAYKARHASLMLVFDAVVDALDRIAASEADGTTAAGSPMDANGLPASPPAARATG